MSKATETIGLIAGNRNLPLLFAKQARQMGVQQVVAVGFEGETDPGLASEVDEMVWLKVGQLSKLVDAFKRRDVRRCVMLGQVSPKSLFDVRPDLRAMSLLLRLKEKNAHSIFGALAGELLKDGIELIDPRPWLGPAMPGPGFCLGPKLTGDQKSDVAFGFKMAKEISRLEIGQSVVVKGGTVLAVEGFEGTDECLRRGGALAGRDGGAVAAKVAKEKHDVRFDIPCIGPTTIEICADARISVLAFDAGMTLVLEMDAVSALARQRGVSVVSVPLQTS
jgi:UDP-2,3-diacylglucosamine hydrolase